MPFLRKTRYSVVRSTPKRQIPEGLWFKCKNCGSVLYKSKQEDNLNVCTECDFHYQLNAWERIDLLLDEDSFKERDKEMYSVDALEFSDGQYYPNKLKEARKKTDLADAIVCGEGKINDAPLAFGVMDFRFLGASMGSVVGEKFTRLTEFATKNRLPLVVTTASGGARMQEGMLSLMQMAKTSGALAVHKSAGLPYIVLMTHPTTAGVSASFASLGDVIVAEPGALIGFAGPRVIKQTTQAELPENFQRAEFLVEHGFIDRVIHRSNLRDELSLLLTYFSRTRVGDSE